MFTIDKVLDEIMQLDFATREMLVDILHKRQIEERRKDIAGNARKARSAFKHGKLKAHTSSEVIRHLNSL